MLDDKVRNTHPLHCSQELLLVKSDMVFKAGLANMQPSVARVVSEIIK